MDGFLGQIRLLRDEPVTGEELARARKYLIGNHMIGLQTLLSRADELLFPVLYGQDLERALAYGNRVRSVTAGQVQAAAVKYLDPENYTLAVVEGGKRED